MLNQDTILLGQDGWADGRYGNYQNSRVVLSIAKNNPTIDFLVLCGHTHSSSFYQPLLNLLIKAGKAEYYKLEIQELISV